MYVNTYCWLPSGRLDIKKQNHLTLKKILTSKDFFLSQNNFLQSTQLPFFLLKPFNTSVTSSGSLSLFHPLPPLPLFIHIPCSLTRSPGSNEEILPFSSPGILLFSQERSTLMDSQGKRSQTKEKVCQLISTLRVITIIFYLKSSHSDQLRIQLMEYFPSSIY